MSGVIRNCHKCVSDADTNLEMNRIYECSKCSNLTCHIKSNCTACAICTKNTNQTNNVAKFDFDENIYYVD